jgi:hypothetical protein
MKKPKRKIGDTVVIKARDFFLNRTPDLELELYSFLIEKSFMGKFCGKKAFIMYVVNNSRGDFNHYRLDIDGERWAWEDWMFEDKDEQLEFDFGI